MDWIEGHGSVREVLGGLPEEGEVEDDDDEAETPYARLERLQLNEGELFPSSLSEVAKIVMYLLFQTLS